MQEIKILHINDGTSRELLNGERHYMEDYPWAEEQINDYFRQGYRILQAIPDLTPAINQPGSYTFYHTGFTVFLVREAPEE